MFVEIILFNKNKSLFLCFCVILLSKCTCLMYMFRSKRSQLTRRLLRSRLKNSDRDEGRCETQVRHQLLKRLKENQLELLAVAVESCGEDVTACVLLPRDCGYTVPPHLLCCQIWRWPDINNVDELKRLPVCASSSDPVYICCNPYHLSRLVDKPGKS